VAMGAWRARQAQVQAHDVAAEEKRRSHRSLGLCGLRDVPAVSAMIRIVADAIAL
jgi:hypothetical protein